jgi:hypothetical protein
MEILHLTLKKKWFDMILSGHKKEEYREIKPYWIKRLCNKEYDVIKFRNGYGKKSPVIIVNLLEIVRGYGYTHLGAPEKVVFILKLGGILETFNLNNGE